MFGVCLSSTNKKDRLCENPTQHAFWPMETNISSPKSIHYPTNAIQLFSIYSCVDNKPMLITQVYGYPHKGREGFWLTQGHGFRKSRGWQYGGEGSGLGRWTRLHPEHTHTQPHCMTHTTQHTLQHSLSAIRPVLRERLWNPRTANVCVCFTKWMQWKYYCISSVEHTETQISSLVQNARKRKRIRRHY
jgi:hypothetical protein